MAKEELEIITKEVRKLLLKGKDIKEIREILARDNKWSLCSDPN